MFSNVAEFKVKIERSIVFYVTMNNLKRKLGKNSQQCQKNEYRYLGVFAAEVQDLHGELQSAAGEMGGLRKRRRAALRDRQSPCCQGVSSLLGGQDSRAAPVKGPADRFADTGKLILRSMWNVTSGHQEASPKTPAKSLHLLDLLFPGHSCPLMPEIL